MRLMPIKIYAYKKCSTCQKALKFLNGKGLAFETYPIVEQPPTLFELRRMLEHVKADGGTYRQLFNTSGVSYRELGVGEKIKAGLTEMEALKLLASDGKLIKRPFLLTESSGTVGFHESTWSRLF